MKWSNIGFALAALCCLAGVADAQTLKIKANKKYTINTRDSSGVLNVDTLIMGDKSSLWLNTKKSFTIIARHAFIGNKCSINGTDGKNNGTNITIEANFIKLEGLRINIGGNTINNGKREFGNGNGGNVEIIYDANGIVPQSTDEKAAHYVEIVNKGAGNPFIPQSAMQNIKDQIRQNSGSGRPLGGLPQGKVYDANQGKDGTVTIKVKQ